jgi:hypothetical protein
MIRHMTSIPRSYKVEQSERYVCKYCGRFQAIAQFQFHRCRTR